MDHASRIEKLELEVKQLSAVRPDGRAVHVATSTGSSDSVLGIEIANLQRQIREKDTTITSKDAAIAQTEERNLALVSESEKYREVMHEAADWLRETATKIESPPDEGDQEDATIARIEERNFALVSQLEKYHEAMHDVADWLQEKATNIDSSFDEDDQEDATNPSVNYEGEESFLHKLEESDPSSEIGQDIIEADQNRSNGPAHSSPSYTLESHGPASTSLTAESEATFRASDLGEVFLWPRRMRCAFMTMAGDRITGPNGDPFQAMNGWAVYLEVDAGRHGRPNISLHFIINNGKKDAPVSRNQAQHTEFAITWRTGVVNDQCQMIGSFDAHVISDYERSTKPHVAMIADKCPDERQQELTNLVTLWFKSNSFEKPEFSATTKKLWRGLPIDVQQCLDTLFFQDESRWVAIWFCVDSTPELAMSGWISALQRAVNRS